MHLAEIYNVMYYVGREKKKKCFPKYYDFPLPQFTFFPAPVLIG